MCDQLARPGDDIRETLQDGDRAAGTLTGRIEVDTDVSALAGDRQIMAQGRDVTVQIDVRLTQQRTKVQNIGGGIETGDLIRSAIVRHHRVGGRRGLRLRPLADRQKALSCC